MNYFKDNTPIYKEDDGYDHVVGINASEQAGALNWVGGAMAQPQSQRDALDQFANDMDPDKLRAGVQAVMQIVPVVIQALKKNPESQLAFEALTGVDLGEIDMKDREAWPAVIGAVVSALPTVISAVSGLTNKRRRDTRRRPAPRPTPQRQCNCPEPQTHQPPSRETIGGMTDAEAVQWAALVPVILELLPTILPIIAQVLTMTSQVMPSLLDGFSQMSKAVGRSEKKENSPENLATDSEAIEWSVIIPIILGLLPVVLPIIAQLLKMLSKALPSLLDGFSKISSTVNAGKAKEGAGEDAYTDFGESATEVADPLHELSDQQIAAIWNNANQNETLENPESVG